jgi:hypothetical protein
MPYCPVSTKDFFLRIIYEAKRNNIKCNETVCLHTEFTIEKYLPHQFEIIYMR